MKIEIRNRYSHKIIIAGKYTNLKEVVEKHKAYLSGADLSGADLSRADLSRADLSRADLSDADLSRADLSDADLSRAYLSGANLSRADLSGAYLSDARNLKKELTTPLYMLLDQVGVIRAYKIVNSKSEGIYKGGIVYEIGKTVRADNVNEDEFEQCGAGINLASLDWCLKEMKPDYKILVVEFTAKDIAAIPVGSDGKFRVRQCKVIKEWKDNAIAEIEKTLKENK